MLYLYKREKLAWQFDRYLFLKQTSKRINVEIKII